MPKNLQKAYYYIIEQELYEYKFIKDYVTKIINAYLDSQDFEPSLPASNLHDFYIGGQTNKEVTKAHNLVRNPKDTTLDQVLRMMSAKRTFNQAAAAISLISFAEMYRKVTAIDETLDRLKNSNIGDERKKCELVKARYFDNQLTPAGLALKFNISKRTVYNWCGDVIHEIAKRLGMDF